MEEEILYPMPVLIHKVLKKDHEKVTKLLDEYKSFSDKGMLFPPKIMNLIHIIHLLIEIMSTLK